MVNWQDELKTYISKKLSTNFGYEVNPNDIQGFDINDNINLEEVEVKDLAIVYAFALMSEDFEKALLIKNEVESRNCGIEIVNNKDNTSIIRMFDKDAPNVFFIEVHMKQTENGLIMDFEKQEF